MALEAVQAQAGHASIESTRIYLHLADDWLASCAKGCGGYRRPGLHRTPPAARGTTTGPADAGPRVPEATVSGPLLLPTWDVLAVARPELVVTMRAYLTQVGCVLRPGSVMGADLALRSLAAFLIAEHPHIRRVADIDRPQIPKLQQAPGWQPSQSRTVPKVTPATIAHRLGTLRMFFLRIDEWGWDDSPARVPMFHGDVPRQDHALPKALDDPTAAKLLRAGQADKRALVGVTVEFLLRTGLRVGGNTPRSPPTPSS